MSNSVGVEKVCGGRMGLGLTHWWEIEYVGV